ncbi:hypothetical protein HNQ96_006160 [Aminobacter lissarensis]|uniref:Uncharacterized protein n=1 Tax=Aminobacter carboxidus TaxID=376165 RepID=A0A8E1WLG0_9HYPH|nr:hypothetical protein [Aminobacter lissarensis]MBB6470263.1 hypothetical protein [Aminobacter lissarensis]
MRALSPSLMKQISLAIDAVRSDGQINIVQIADRVQNDNPNENVALEDILSVALDMAQATGNVIVLEKAETEQLTH